MESWVVVQNIWATFGLVAFKVILRPFVGFSIFRNLGLMVRDKRKHFKWHLTLNDLERSKSRSLRFQSFVSLYLVKEQS